MKADREHIVPLTDAVIDVLRRGSAFRETRGDLVFPGMRAAKPMSDMTLTKICRDIGVEAMPRSFRSSFRDGVSEETDFDGDIAEMALAHTIQHKVEAAYRRGNLLEKRSRLMDAWSSYCLAEVGGVIRVSSRYAYAPRSRTVVGRRRSPQRV